MSGQTVTIYDGTFKEVSVNDERVKCCQSLYSIEKIEEL